MKGRILSVTLALSILTGSMGTAFAENPKADEYRKIFASGTYTVEYEQYGTLKKTLEVSGEKRMDYTTFKTGGNPALAALAIINPLLGVAALFGGGAKKEPSALYQDGKYYQFHGKKKATMALESQLEDPNLDPKENWSTVRYRLALPEELVVFAPQDAFNSVSNFVVPTFLESKLEQKDKSDPGLPYDIYSSPIKSVAGNQLAEKFFYMYYDKKGDLNKIKTTFKEPGKDEIEISSMNVKKISGEMGKNALQIPKGCKVYAAGIGDMNDLLDKPVLVEDYSEKKSDKGE